MNIRKKIIQSFTVFILVSFASGFVLPAMPVRAFGPGDVKNLLDQTVPVNVVDGSLGLIADTAIDETAIGQEMIRSVVNSALAGAYSFLGGELNNELENNANINNFVNYSESLKRFYTSSALTATLGVDSSSLGDYRDLDKIFEDYSAIPLNTQITPSQAARLGAFQSKQTNPAAQARFQQDVTRLILGATSMFTSSISCGGINQSALQNTTRYLAAASAGVVAQEINSASANFYKDMAKLGSPYSTPPFWALTLNSMSREAESRATQAATLEQISPGKKATRDINPFSGPKIVRSTNVILSAQNQTLGSILNAGIIGGTNSIYAGRSFANFVVSIGSYYAQYYALVLAKRISGGLISGAHGGSWVITLSALGGVVAQEVTRAFAKSMYDKLISVVFQGKLLGESVACRGKTRLTDFKSTLNTNNITEGDLANRITFTITPQTIVKGVSEPQVRLSWDASVLGANVQVNIDKVGTGNVSSVPLPAVGSRDDVINLADPRELDNCKQRLQLSHQCQEYRLVIIGASQSVVPISRHVNILENDSGDGGNPINPDQVLFVADPSRLDSPGISTISWDVSQVPNASIISITASNNVSQDFPSPVPVIGFSDVSVDQTTNFVITVTNGSDTIPKSIRVVVSNIGVSTAISKQSKPQPFKVRE